MSEFRVTAKQNIYDSIKIEIDYTQFIECTFHNYVNQELK